MVRVALVGSQFAEQLRTNPEALGEVEVAWVGSEVAALERQLPALRVDALALEVADQAGLSADSIRSLVSRSHAELAVVSYGFTTRAFLRDLRDERIRVLQAPLSLGSLRAHLAFLLVRDLLSARPASNVACACVSETERAASALIELEARERSCPHRDRLGAATHAQLDALSREARDALQRAVTLVRPPAPRS
ncbi:MAG: hypothetical protein JST54_24690 [Deltaproteobacteria bacterium]|nr:hypothetical protein [Deltaproteobacteria bacterium]